MHCVCKKCNLVDFTATPLSADARVACKQLFCWVSHFQAYPHAMKNDTPQDNHAEGKRKNRLPRPHAKRSLQQRATHESVQQDYSTLTAPIAWPEVDSSY